MWWLYKHNTCEKIRSLHSFTHFTNILREVERKWIKRKKRGARERAWDWRLGVKVKLGFGFLKNYR